MVFMQVVGPLLFPHWRPLVSARSLRTSGRALASHPFQRLREFLRGSAGPSIQADRISKLTLVDYVMATLAVGIMIGFPVLSWISGMH